MVTVFHRLPVKLLLQSENLLQATLVFAVFTVQLVVAYLFLNILELHLGIITLLKGLSRVVLRKD